MSGQSRDVPGPDWASMSDHHRTWSVTVLLHRWTRLLDCVNRQRLRHPNVKSQWSSQSSSQHLPYSSWNINSATVFANHRNATLLVMLRFFIFFLLTMLSPHSCWCHSEDKSSWNNLRPHTHQTVHYSRLHSTHSYHSTSAIDDSVLVSQHQAYLEKYQNQWPEFHNDVHSVSSSGAQKQHPLHQSRPLELSQTKCVEQCSCKWRSGKMWVECPNASLQYVPRGLDSGTQVLHLSGNPLAELEARVFERAGLNNLQRLYLARCRLRDIHADAFQQLSNLIELDLAQNQLSNLPTGSLYNCPFLRKLNLARNQIRVLKNSALAKLEKLQFIDFSGNALELIEPNAFFGLKDLKQLHLHDNQLRSVDGQTMRSLPSVYELTLQHNPWRCDCTLRAFRDWMLEHRIPLSYSPNCSTPTRLMTRPWSQLDLDEFACSPEVISVDSEVVVYEGENASIGCVMAAIPNVHIEWEWRGKTIRNMSLMTFGRQMYLIRESYSPAGVTMSILPVNRDQEDGVDLDLPDGSEDLLSVSEGASQQDLMMQSAVVQPELEIRQLEKRVRGVRSAEEHEADTYRRTSTLYIMNALEKDSGSYVCTGSNKAGTVSANVTLTVLRRLEVTAAAYSGEEVAGIVLGALFVFLLTFVAVCFVVLRSKKGSDCGRGETTTTLTTNTSQSNGTLNSNQTLLTTVAANGRIANGHLPNGHARRHSNTSTDTKESKMSSLIVSLNGAHNGNGTVKRFVVLPEEPQDKMNICTNQLAEQFELCHYSTHKVDTFAINSDPLPEVFDSGRARALPDATHQLPNGSIYPSSNPSPNPLYPLSSANSTNFTPTEHQYSMPTRHYPAISSAASSLYNSIAPSDEYSVPVSTKSAYNHYYTLDSVQLSPVRCSADGFANGLVMMPKVDLVNEMNKRRAAVSVAEELQGRLAASGGQMKHNCSLEMTPSGMIGSASNQGQMVRFANSPTVYSYPATGAPSSVVMMPSSGKQASPLNRVRNGANPVIARDSPDEGLGEETDGIE